MKAEDDKDLEKIENREKIKNVLSFQEFVIKFA